MSCDNEASQPVDEGGINLFRDDNGAFNLGMSSFQKCLPVNLVGRIMTNSNRVMLGCQTCIDAKQMMTTLKEWRNRQCGRMKEDVVRLKQTADANPDDNQAKLNYEASVKARDTYRDETCSDPLCTVHRQNEMKGRGDSHDVSSCWRRHLSSIPLLPWKDATDAPCKRCRRWKNG